MPLQGVWTADDGKLPPWKGDYHNDLNTQLSYTHFYKANHLEEGESFLEFFVGSKRRGETICRKILSDKRDLSSGRDDDRWKTVGRMADVFVVTDPPDLAVLVIRSILSIYRRSHIFERTGMDLFSGNRTVYPRTFTKE